MQIPFGIWPKSRRVVLQFYNTLQCFTMQYASGRFTLFSVIFIASKYNTKWAMQTRDTLRLKTAR